jgi:hypothetical protein
MRARPQAQDVLINLGLPSLKIFRRIRGFEEEKAEGFFLRVGDRDGVLDKGSRRREREICQMVTVVERDREGETSLRSSSSTKN